MKKYLLLTLTIVIVEGINAQNTFTINEAIDYALKNNAKITNANLEIEKANQKIKETTAIGLPQINAEGGFNHFIDIATTVASASMFNPLAPPDAIAELQFGTKFTTNASVTATQLLFDGSYIVGLQTSKKYKGISTLQKKKTAQEIKEGVLKAYYNVLVSNKSIKTIENMLKSTTKIYQETKLVYKQGLIEEDNVDQLSLSVLNTKNALASTRRQLQNAKDYLKHQMSYDITADISTSTDFEGLINALSISDSENKNEISSNLDYQLLNKQIELGVLKVKYEKSRSLPSLAAFFTHQQSAMRNKFDFFDNKAWYPTTLWGLKLSVPIWSSGQSKALRNQAKINLKQSENQLKLLESGLNIQVKMAENNFRNAYDTYLSQKEGVVIAKKIYGKSQIKFKEGIISSMELTQSQTQYLTSEANYIKAMFNLINTKVELDKLTNKL